MPDPAALEQLNVGSCFLSHGYCKAGPRLLLCSVWEATKDLASGSTKQANGGSKEAATQSQAAAHCRLW